MTNNKPSVLITGASTGLGAIYADRFAKRGHDLVLVARDRIRMEELAERLRRENGVSVDVMRADLTDERDLAEVELRLRQDDRIGILINNAGMSKAGGFIEQTSEDVAKIAGLNAIAVLRLAHAAAPRMAKAGNGAIVNISSVIGLGPEFGTSVYGATKAFVTFLSQSLNNELAPAGVYVQAVLPSATRTEIWDRSGTDISKWGGVMEAGELVDAALVGFDRRESVTIPPLPNAGQFEAYEAARKAMLPNFRQEHAAARYQKAA